MSNHHNNQLNTYRWTGVTPQGKKTHGLINASHIILAKNKLCSQGIIVKTIRKNRLRWLDGFNKKITQSNITMFSRQMATLVSAGVPVVQSCEIILKAESNSLFGQKIHQIKHDIETGKPLAEALQQHPTIFNELFCSLIDAGEKSGCLDTMLNHLATYQEKIESLKKKIKKALAYPLLVLVVSCLITVALLVLVVPQFQTLFIDFGADLPVMTRAIITLSQFFQTYWALLLFLISASLCLIIHTKKKSPQLTYIIENIILNTPIFGAMIKNAAVARFSRTLAMTFAAGLPLVDALKLVAGATGNNVLRQASYNIRSDIATGQSLHQSIENTLAFPNRLIQMVAIGEESGKLEHMLTKTADFYEQEVDLAVETLSSLLEPIIMVILGILVGGLVIAMYLPIFKLGSVV